MVLSPSLNLKGREPETMLSKGRRRMSEFKQREQTRLSSAFLLSTGPQEIG